MALSKGLVKRTPSVDPAAEDFLTLSDGLNRRAQATAMVDENGDHAGTEANPIRVRIAEPDPSVNSGAVPVREYTIMANPGTLAEVRVQLDPAALLVRYLLLFDLTSTPVNGTVPVWSLLVPAAGIASESWSRGLDFGTNGCRAVLSSTPGQLTIVPGNECYIYASRRED